MKRTLVAALLFAATPLQAQDIVGLEDCSKAQGVDRKLGCLQSNVNYLNDQIRKRDADAQAKLRDAAARITAANARIHDLHAEIERLKAAVEAVTRKGPAK